MEKVKVGDRIKIIEMKGEPQYKDRKAQKEDSSKGVLFGVIFHSAIPYFTLTRSIFSSMGSAAIIRKMTVPKPWMRSIGSPVT